jgi:hypothetical protein
MLDSIFNDLIHQSLLSVRGAIDFLVDDDYRITSSDTTVPGTFSTSSSGYTDNTGDPIAVGTIYDMTPKNLSLRGLTQFVGEIPIFLKDSFDAKRSVLRTYNSDFAVTKGIATVYSTTSGTVIIAVYGYPTATTAPTFELTYLRQPTKLQFNAGETPATTDAKTVDIPDRWVSLVIDHCSAQIFKRLGKGVPDDIEARMRADVKNVSTMLSSNFNPQTVR